MPQQTILSSAILAVFLGAVAVYSPSASAASCVPSIAGNLCASYVLSGVTFTADTVNGSPASFFYGTKTAVMTGQFDWQYAAGDFLNGTGTFTQLTVPFTHYGIGDLILSIDNTSLNGTLPGNIHSQGVDFIIALAPGLTSPALGSGIDYATSTFDIWDSGGNEYMGHVSAGSIVPSVATVPLPAARGCLAPACLDSLV